MASISAKHKLHAYRISLTASAIVLFLLTITPIHTAQMGPTDWTRSYGGSGADGVASVIETADGFVLLGWRHADNLNVLLAKVDTDGEIQWSQQYGGSKAELCFDGLQLDDGSFLLTGYTYTIGAGSGDFMLLKLNADFQTQWVKAYGGSDLDIAHQILQTNDGGLILIGFTDSAGLGRQALLVKTDIEGELNWMQSYGGNGWEEAQAITPTSDNGYAIAGWSSSFSDSTDAWLVKLDDRYQQQWQWTYGGSEIDGINAMIQTADDGFLLAGYTESYGEGSRDGLLVKIKSNGQLEWANTYGSTSTDLFKEIIPTVDGGYALLGTTSSYGSGENDFWLVKTDANGNMLWSESYGGADHDNLYGGIQSTDGGYALVGTTYSYGAGRNDMWIVKTPSFTTTTATTPKFTISTPIQTAISFTVKPAVSFTVNPAVSFSVNPQPITGLTLTSAPDDPLSLTDAPMVTKDVVTSFNTAVTFTTGSITNFEPATTTTSLTSTDTTSTSSQAPVTVTVTDTETDSGSPTPGFMSLPALLGLSVIVLVFRKLKK